jgi:signal transduction histidine kinase
VLHQAGRSTSIVDAFYVWSEEAPGGDASPVARLDIRRDGRLLDLAESVFAEASGPVSHEMREMAAEMAGQRLPWGTRLDTIDGRPQVLVIHLLFDSSARQRLTSFIGFRVDLERLERDYLPGAIGPRLADVNRQSGLARLMAAVVDEGGRVVHVDGAAEAGSEFLDEREVPLQFFDPDLMPAFLPSRSYPAAWRLRVGYGAQSVATLAEARTRGPRILLLSLALVVVAGVLFAARMAIQEVRLAEARSNFVANVSHDLKTPLALIQLFAETLHLGRVRSAEKAREYYAIINGETRKLSSLINNVLDFSRIESGFRMFRLEPVTLGDLVQRVVRGFDAQAAHLGFRVSLDVQPDLPTVLADAESVELALGNLLSNAMKYSGAAREVDVAARRAGRNVEVLVTDRGIGIPKRLQRKIFRKFFRIDVEGGPGTPRGCGLGLAIVDQVMRAHGGRASVDSEPGRGSTFVLTFPVSKEHLARDEADSRDRRRAPDAAGAA